MVVEYIRYQVAADQRQALVEAYHQAANQLAAAPECLAYELSECEEEAGQFILRIEWSSTEAHLQGFRKGPQFAAFFAHIKGFYASIQEMRHYRPTTVAMIKNG
jgi:hemoglobin